MYDDPQDDYNARHAPEIMFPTKPNKVIHQLVPKPWNLLAVPSDKKSIKS